MLWLHGVIVVLVWYVNMSNQVLKWSPVVIRVQVCVCYSGWVDCHTLHDWGRSRYCLLALLNQVCLGGSHPVETVASDSRKDWKIEYCLLLLYCRFFAAMCWAQAVVKTCLFLLLGVVHWWMSVNVFLKVFQKVHWNPS